jgi:hypothetical protein
MAPRARPPSREAPAAQRLRALLETGLGRWLARVGTAALVLLVIGVVVRQARAHAYRLPAYRLGPTSIRFADLPPWADTGLLRALADPSRLRVDVSVFDPDAEARIREVVSRHPVVREVRRVVVTYPNRATVSVRLRVPRAVVATTVPGETPGEAARTSYELLSDDQHLLDPTPYRGYLAERAVMLPVLVGIRSRPPPVGEAWRDREEQVAEGAEAARVAARLYRDLGARVLVERIDLSRFPARPEERAEGEIRFHLADGSVVEWGRTGRDPAEAGEDPYAEKLRRLEAWLQDETLRAKKRVDVRYRMRTAAPARGS